MKMESPRSVAPSPRSRAPYQYLADWRRTGVSASHNALFGEGAHEVDTAQSLGGGDDMPKRKIVSSELPKQHDDKISGSHHQRGLVPVIRRLRSASGNKKVSARYGSYLNHF